MPFRKFAENVIETRARVVIQAVSFTRFSSFSPRFSTAFSPRCGSTVLSPKTNDRGSCVGALVVKFEVVSEVRSMNSLVNL